MGNDEEYYQYVLYNANIAHLECSAKLVTQIPRSISSKPTPAAVLYPEMLSMPQLCFNPSWQP